MLYGVLKVDKLEVVVGIKDSGAWSYGIFYVVLTGNVIDTILHAFLKDQKCRKRN